MTTYIDPELSQTVTHIEPVQKDTGSSDGILWKSKFSPNIKDEPTPFGPLNALIHATFARPILRYKGYIQGQTLKSMNSGEMTQ